MMDSSTYSMQISSLVLGCTPQSFPRRHPPRQQLASAWLVLGPHFSGDELQADPQCSSPVSVLPNEEAHVRALGACGNPALLHSPRRWRAAMSHSKSTSGTCSMQLSPLCDSLIPRQLHRSPRFRAVNAFQSLAFAKSWSRVRWRCEHLNRG